MDDAPYAEMQRKVREREVALLSRPIKPGIGPTGVKKYDLTQAIKIHEFLGRGLAQDAGRVVEARRRQIEINAKLRYRALYTDKSISLGETRAIVSQQIAMHWKQIHQIGAFRVLGFETQRVQMRQLLLSRGLELEMTNRQREELKLSLEQGKDITRIIHRSLSTTPELVASKNLRVEYVMARGYTLGRSAEQSVRTEIVKATEMAKARAVAAQLEAGKTVSLIKTEKHLELRMEREQTQAAAKAAGMAAGRRSPELALYLSRDTEESRARLAAAIKAVELSRGPQPKTFEEHKAAYLRMEPERPLAMGKSLAMDPAAIMAEQMRIARDVARKKGFGPSRGMTP